MPSRKGFTLIELLVVIAIIAVLIGLLLPAIQKVRGAAANSQCQNNLKQIGLALNAYNGTHNSMPAGGMRDTAGGSWGSSWMVYLLPYVEQEGLFSSFQFTGNSGWGLTTNPANASGKMINVYRCPATTRPKWVPSTPPGGTSPGIMQPTYVGIAGAANGLIPGFTDTSRVATGANVADCCGGGIAASNGSLFPGDAISITTVTGKDGTSNTLFVSEHSDLLQTVNGAQQNWGNIHGWLIGSYLNSAVGSGNNGADVRHFNMVTIRYQINQLTGWTNSPGNCGGTGVCNNNANNTPLTSTHPGGGVNGVMGDGSVRFLTSNITIDTLARLAIRDDGGTPTNY